MSRGGAKGKLNESFLPGKKLKFLCQVRQSNKPVDTIRNPGVSFAIQASG